jgi:O-antigen/teichoic acid export membrane protein
MIGWFTVGHTENGYYEQAMRITKMVLVLVTSLSTVMVPRIGQYFSEKNKDAIQSAMYKAYRFSWFLSLPLMFGLFGIADSFIPWFYGPGYEKVNVLLKIVSVIAVAISINNVTGIQYLVPTKREKLYTRTVLIGALINCCLNFILIPKLLSYGAAIASVIAEISIAVIQLIYVRKELDIKRIIAPIYKYLIAGVLMLGLLLVEDYFFPAKILFTFIMIITGAAFYFLLLVVFHDDFFIENAKILINKFY